MGSINGFQRRLKVLHLDHTGQAGGAELALVRLLNAQDKWDASIITPRAARNGPDVYSSDLPTDLIVRRVGRSQSVGVSRNTAGIKGTIALLADIVLQAVAIRTSREFRQADVIHANTSRAALYGALACLFSRKDFVVHLRDIVNSESLGSAGFWAFKALILKRADGLIGNSNASLGAAIPHIGSRSVQRAVIPSPIGFSSISSHTAAMSDVVPRRLRIGMVARIDPWKGQELLLRAFASRFRGQSIELLFAGAPAFGHERYLDRLQKLAEQLDVGGQTVFLGHVHEVGSFISSLDICVQASIRPEPLGQNVLQYLAAGRAAVVANEGGPVEWVRHRHNGLTFKARDEMSLGGVLSELVEDDELRSRLAECARDTPGLILDSVVAARHYEFFSQVASGGQSRR